MDYEQLIEATEGTIESINKAFEIMDRSHTAYSEKPSYWADAEVWLNNAKGNLEEALNS